MPETLGVERAVTKTYTGSCHCGAVRFRFRSEEITRGLRCNCSICIRKGAVMSTRYFEPADFEELTGLEALGLYQWGDKQVNNYFCKTCGIYPFHEVTAKPGHYRVNLGCVDELNPLELAIDLVDGKSF
jgi:hypothetical protein